MPRRARSLLDEAGIFHVTGRGTGGCFIYRSELDRFDFADLFWRSALEFQWRCHVAIEMGTHYHAVLEGRREDISLGMRKLNGAYARRFNARHGRRGHLFEDRFSSWVVEDDTRLEATIPYVLWNPVRANLRSSPLDWDWSWLEPARASAMGSGFERFGTGDCPMGQSLRRVCEGQRRPRPKRSSVGRPQRTVFDAAVTGREQDDL